MAIKILGPKKPQTGTLLSNAKSVAAIWYNVPKQPKPNWDKWLNVDSLELREAVALSLNIEPPKYNLDGINQDFDDRMHVVLSHLKAGMFGGLRAGEPARETQVRLIDIARLAESCTPAWGLPPEFPKYVEQPPQAPTLPVLQASSTGKTTVHKLRKNSLDVPIEKAIEQAGSTETGAVYLKLKELALAGEAPFSGEVNNGVLHYTKDNDKPGTLTKKALGKRLRNYAPKSS